MNPRALNPILNVSDFAQSVDWFKRLGWEQGWHWGDPPTFGAVWAGQCEIFLCQGGQGGRGRGPHTKTFGSDGDQTGDKGVWMSIWVADVDEVYRHCLAQGWELSHAGFIHQEISDHRVAVARTQHQPVLTEHHRRRVAVGRGVADGEEFHEIIVSAGERQRNSAAIVPTAHVM